MKSLIFNISIDHEYIRNLGAYRVAQVLRKYEWDVEVIDFVSGWTLEQLKALFKSRYSKDLKFLGISQLFVFWNEHLESFFSWVKKNYPEVYIIHGSQSHFNFDTEAIDYYVNGYGEHAIVELVQYLFSNGRPVKFSLSNPKKKIIPANTFYSAGYETDLMTLYEDRDFIVEGEWLMMEFSRGCKFSCDFCNFPFLNAKGKYILSSEDFSYQMSTFYEKYGVKDYICADSTFNDTTEKIIHFANEVEKLNFQPWFSGYIRADLLISRPDDREHLLRMGFTGHSYGVETFNKASGKAIKKGMDPEKVKSGLIDIKKYFLNNGRQLYRGHLNLIAGLPFETKQSLMDTIKWVDQHWSDQSASMFPLSIETSKSPFQTNSQMSIDYKAYGYREIADSTDNLRMIGVHGDFLNWENDQMNLSEASKISKLLQRTTTDTWTIAALRFLGVSIQDRLQLPASAINDESLDKVYNDFLEKYISNKLSL